MNGQIAVMNSDSNGKIAVSNSNNYSMSRVTIEPSEWKLPHTDA